MAFPMMAAVAVGLMPQALLQRLAASLFASVIAAHPSLIERLGPHGSLRFDFVPTDMDIRFRIVPASHSIAVLRGSADGEADASVAGPLHLLLLLAEGGADADALFFSRDLTVTGDMEALLALRNVLDDCRIDIPAGIADLAGPFGGLAERAARHIRQRVLEGEASAWN